ncbi:hypothetical protein CF327_g6326 [Tilletia walkeri]|uniref:Uncharacterized protein n=1 Tax=Tilletia walkeri TaxID=117179 RepID=A0A8X7N558_9BASI|nr:hypothetical protein CF327_g6326 [Tilletia walkeri]KAE8267301.1 hypothetical protein A4X09_0g5045 [Tilletia walkeri]
MNSKKRPNDTLKRMEALQEYEVPSYTNDELGLQFDTTAERLQHIHIHQVADRRSDFLSDADFEGPIKDALKKVRLGKNPTELLKVAYPDQRTSFSKQSSDTLNELLDELRRRKWCPDKVQACRRLLDLVAYSVLREGGLKQKHGTKKPPYDPRSRSFTEPFFDCYDDLHGILPNGNAVFNHSVLKTAWRTLFEDQLELARSNFEVWSNSFDVLLLFVGLLSGVIATFVTSFNLDQGSRAAQAVISGYRIALILTLIAGGIALRERYILTGLSGIAVRSEKQNAAKRLPERLLKHVRSVAFARERVPAMLFASAQLLLLAIIVFVAAFLTGIVAPPNNTDGDWVSFGIGLAIIIGAIFTASVLLSDVAESCWSALARRWTACIRSFANRKTPTTSTPSELPSHNGEQTPAWEKNTIGSGAEWVAFFQMSAGIDSSVRSKRVGAAVYRTLAAHCPRDFEQVHLIADAIRNLIALGAHPLLSDLLDCAVLVYDRKLSSERIWREVDQSSREVARNLKLNKDNKLAEQVRAATKLFQFPTDSLRGTDIRYVLTRLLASTEPSCSFLPEPPSLGRKRNVVMKMYTALRNQAKGNKHAMFFLAINDVHPDEHLTLSIWSVRRLACDVHMLRRTSLWYVLFAFAAPAGILD